ncbi:serine/threonine-protein kinase PknG [Amycolatopsis acidiphila]|uniref:non-specific serine/threonine protein kinase n=1 Tax=Amycolatopsis acidiphila TaxID=715473 RepID=A0A558AKI1_9PSEU|nr:serine/threonine-protein kinase [Amycolatopsis acidiphila]TVT24769.1 protein kinase [Amycolatopsis acidiphila]UIJ62738.1 serine/threonine-protein kinase PknG [Amycolatopsis acidiphila]GHG63892.1 putative serine/threonine-protein kinase [Amycolatopsis acidiphila]
MSACPRSGCDGRIDEDGFCDACGLEAPQAGLGPATSSTGFSAPTSVSWSTPVSASSSRPARGSTRSASRNLLGRGVIDVPNVPRRDPREAVLTDPQVPENKRFCSACGAKVGRGHDGEPGRVEGFCPQCGHRFSFTPKLCTGELVHEQYEVLGCLAHGGLGWIYLAADHRVADRWVVLKGLLDTGDADAMAAAIAETKFLAQVEHPSIVRIYNFVEHRGTGYIVMEYVGGTSIKDLVKQRREQGEPTACLPITQAIAYTLEILPALGHLHASGLVYCDFKPDNAIQVEDQLKLIDLGAVRHCADSDSPIYGTAGYQAPEIGKQLPSPVSDVYTVGRALAVMTFPFDFHHAYRDTLPPADEVPLLAEFESFHRLLLRATHPDPGRRFGSAEEMRDQLDGVFREVAATLDGQPRTRVSTEFTPERRTFGVRGRPALTDIAAALPVPRVDLTDPGTAFLATLAETGPQALVAELSDAPVQGVEIKLRLARAQIDAGDPGAARKTINTAKLAPGDWRGEWYRGIAALADGKPHQARQSFEAVYDLVPGETAPKLAIAACAEAADEAGDADRYYRTVWRADRTFISAAFGLARAMLDKGNRAEAVDVLESVPETSSHYLAAQLAAIRARTASTGLSEEDLVTAGERLSRLELDEYRRAQASRDLLRAALDWVGTNTNGGGGTVLGCRLREQDLRKGLETWYLRLARQATGRLERIALVDEANRVRPRTWF